MESSSSILTHEYHRLINGQHHDPFQVLGLHPESADTIRVTVFAPHVEKLSFDHDDTNIPRVDGTDFFVWRGPSASVPRPYRLKADTKTAHQYSFYDAYCFPPQVPDFDLGLFSEGKHLHVYRILGANHVEVDGVRGILFATWAPNAQRVSVVGDFNDWDGRRHPMRNRGHSGVWELFIPELEAGEAYKLEILNHQTGQVSLKTDPYGRAFEKRPANASLIAEVQQHVWQDQAWLDARQHFDWQHRPISTYEVHLGSWMRDEYGGFLNYRELAHKLGEHVSRLNFTHVELLPITEHPLDDSWGYQVTGYFAPTSRFGSADDFRYLMDHLHGLGIGVILDWVPAHFPKDDWALSNFDGAPLYEHADSRRGEHADWGTKIFNLSRNEVRNFLLSSAVMWIEDFHIDGIRMDAVASMLYLDYSRNAGEWLPNEFGGRENLEAIAFIRELNHIVGTRFPGVIMIAEESTAWPGVSRPPEMGGLGFSMKWNMGWMHDSLHYMENEPVHRKYHHNQLTFGMMYCFTENFVLPFSHDEVVHLKGSMLGKMPGDRWQQFANLRLLYTYMLAYPGKKLLFMGSELAQFEEWNHNKGLEWSYLDYPAHQGISTLLGDLNRLYRDIPALHRYDFEPKGFDWLDCSDSHHSVISFLRKDGADEIVVVLNFTPLPRHHYRIPIATPGTYDEIFNSDSSYYGGSNIGNAPGRHSEEIGCSGRPHSLTLHLPPLGGLLLRRR